MPKSLLPEPDGPTKTITIKGLFDKSTKFEIPSEKAYLLKEWFELEELSSGFGGGEAKSFSQILEELIDRLVEEEWTEKRLDSKLSYYRKHQEMYRKHHEELKNNSVPNRRKGPGS